LFSNLVELLPVQVIPTAHLEIGGHGKPFRADVVLDFFADATHVNVD